MEEKRKTGVALGLAIVALVLSGTSLAWVSSMEGRLGEPSEDEEPPEISGDVSFISNFTGGVSRASIDNLIVKFEEMYPEVNVVFEGVTTSQRDAILATRFKAGNPPEMGNMQAGYTVLKYAISGDLEPLDDIFEELNLEEAIPQTILNEVKYKGHYYSIPMIRGTQSLIWYNKHIIQEAGIDEPIHFETWDDFIQACKTVEEKTDYDGFSIGSKGGMQEIRDFGMILSCTPEDIKTGFLRAERMANGRATEQDFIPALEIFGELMKYANANHASQEPAMTQGNVAAGRAAFGMTGNWGYLFMLDKELVPEEDFWFTGIPGDVMVTHGATFYVSKEGANKPAALAFIRWAASKEGQTIFTSIRKLPPPRTDIKMEITPPGELGWDPYDEKLVELLDYAAQEGRTISSIFVILPAPVRVEWMDVLVSFATGELSAEEAAALMIEIQNDYLAEYVIPIDIVEGGPID